MKLNPTEYIQKYGGKIGGHMYLKDLEGFDEFLPEAVILHPGQDFDEIKGEIRKMVPLNFRRDFTNPLIVRGSHPNDHEGLVDAIYSEPNVTNIDHVGAAIERVIEKANRPEVFSYNKYEGQPYDGKIMIMIAEQLMDKGWKGVPQDAYRGSIIEHPHERDTYIIEVASPTITSRRYLERSVVKDGNIVHSIDDGDIVEPGNVGGLAGDIERLNKIMDLYNLVRFSEFIPEEYSFQMEFGYSNHPKEGKDNVQFFQARPFKKFEEPLFGLGDHEKSDYLCFGITPEEGIILSANILRGGNDDEVMKVSEPYALIIFQNSEPQPLTFQPGHIKAYLAHGARSASLEHNHYRWARKADITILDKKISGRVYGRASTKIKIISNGINYSVETLDGDMPGVIE